MASQRPGSQRLIANFGAEEDTFAPAGHRVPATRPAAVERALARLASSWRALFGAGAVLDDASDDRAIGARAIDLPDDPRVDMHEDAEPVFAWLAEPGVWPWLSTPAADRRAAALGMSYCASPPDVTAHVHDKAFAVRAARDLGHEPLELHGQLVVLEPAEVTRAHIHDVIAGWPTAARASFTLKPRFGTSGRGRVAGHGALPDDVDRALARLARRGGAVLEPWLARTHDLSALWHVERDGAPTLLGTTRQIVSASGVWRGNTFVNDDVVRADTVYDGAFVEAARSVVARAAAVGLRGPCGVDGLVFERDGRAVLRPVLELNARFTSGHVALGLARRARAPAPATCTFRLGATELLTYAG